MSTAVAAKPLRQVANVRELLVNDMAKQQLSIVAAHHMRPERMMRLMANALTTTPKLGECEPITLLGAMMTCASLGLEPNTVLGHAYLIPFGKTVTLVIGYKGMIDLARRSGNVVSIHADVVYAGDEFSYEYGSNQHLRHVPGVDRENPTHAYCHAKLTDGEAFIVLPWSVVMKTRDGSQGYKTAMKYGKKDTPWIAHEHQMARKTAVRALFNELPISIEKVSDAIEVDERKTNFAAFAMDPTSGVTIDGEYIDEDEPAGAPESAEEGHGDDKGGDAADKGGKSPKAAAREPAKAKKPKPEPAAKASGEKAAEAKDSDDADPAAAYRGVADRIISDIAAADDAGAIEATLELFAENVAEIRECAPTLADEIDAAADERREGLAAEEESA